MNRCSISQEETTKAITTQFLVPAPTVHGLQPTVHPGAPQSGLMSVDPLHPDQRRQPFGPQTGAKKKHGTKDLSNEPKQERPSLSSNSAKNNLQPSNKTISLNGANQSSSVNEVDFQDSGQSSSLIAEKQRFKHKEKQKHRENFVDEGILMKLTCIFSSLCFLNKDGKKSMSGWVAGLVNKIYILRNYNVSLIICFSD